MVERERSPVLIAGAGVGGLTAAFSLARAGFEVALIERATRFEEIGAGLQLSPNASRILIELGLGPALARNATAPDRLVVHRLSRERPIGRMPMNARNPFGAPFWVTLRKDLQTALIDAARGEPRIAFRVGRTVETVSQQADGVVVEIATASGARETMAGAALIGADGVWSRARAAVGDAAKPAFSGFEAWRAVIPASDAPETARAAETHVWMSRAAHLVHYPVARGTLINLVLVLRAPPPPAASESGWDASADPAALRDVVAHAVEPARSLIRRASSWRRWPLYDRGGLGALARGRIALIGDAAHPVLPFLAQGAALAVEDAAVLAQEAARAPDDLALAFSRYAARRRERAARVQKASRANARAYHAGGLAALARDLVIARLGEDGMLNRYRWLYGWTQDS
mgnify:CR=1 FL=1